MCGICGYVSFRQGLLGPEAAGRVEAMLGALAHRGPDASALHAAGSAVLGATRLAIRGLVDGRQPLVDGASGVVAVCNGEIDNYRELKAWLAERGRPVAQATDVAVIPGLYLELGSRPDLVAVIREEYRLTRRLVLEITGNARLLEAHPILRQAVDLRNPYVDALSFLQLRFLRQLRAGVPDSAAADRLADLVLLTVNGVAAGLQNTG